jgi:hypothetical protein
VLLSQKEVSRSGNNLKPIPSLPKIKSPVNLTAGKRILNAIGVGIENFFSGDVEKKIEKIGTVIKVLTVVRSIYQEIKSLGSELVERFGGSVEDETKAGKGNMNPHLVMRKYNRFTMKSR